MSGTIRLLIAIIKQLLMRAQIRHLSRRVRHGDKAVLQTLSFVGVGSRQAGLVSSCGDIRVRIASDTTRVIRFDAMQRPAAASICALTDGTPNRILLWLLFIIYLSPFNEIPGSI